MKKVFTSEEEIKIRELYATGKYTRPELAQFFPGRTADQCVSYLHRNKIVLDNHVFWTKEEDEKLIKLCNEGKVKFEDMYKFFENRTVHSVMNRAAKLGIGSNYSHKKYSFDENYFDELTLENIYYGGFFAADACIQKIYHKYKFEWTICEKDLSHMLEFRDKIKSDYPISSYAHSSPAYSDRIYRQYKISINRATKWAEKLKEHFGIVQHKTKRFPPPNLKNNIQKLTYLKGLVDGDGFVCTSGKKQVFMIGICSCNKEILIWIKDFIDNLGLPSLSQNGLSNIGTKAGDNAYYYSITGLRSAVLHEILIRIQTPYLKRKWENPKILEIIKYWKSRQEWPSEIFFGNILNS